MSVYMVKRDMWRNLKRRRKRRRNKKEKISTANVKTPVLACTSVKKKRKEKKSKMYNVI